tara:strand:- start:3795 stop:5966 length:2172 start_codon:yes stop_codon:yes gene_type:complete
MADKEVKVKVTVDADIQPTLAGLKELKKELKEISTTDPRFKQKQQEIDDYTDALNAAKTGAGNFAEVLGGLPGPIGNIGNAIGGTLQNLKQFGALKFSDIKTSFTELGKDVIDAGKGLLQLTGITRAYEAVTAATSKALQFFGVSLNTANTAGKALGVTLSTLLAATGILAIVAAVDILTNAWDNFSKKAERAEEAQKKLNDTLLKGSKVALDAESANVKRSGDLLIAQAKARGANADEIYKIEQSNKKLLLESQQRYYNDLKNKDSDEAIAAINNIKNTQNEIKVAEANFQADKLQKSKQAADKNAEQTKTSTGKDLSDIKKGLEEARLTLLDAKNKELEQVRIKYDELKAQAVKYGYDTKVIEDARVKENSAIADKYAKEDKDKADKILQDKLNSETLALELRLAKGEINETAYQDKLYEIRKQYAINNDDLLNADINREKFRTEEKKKSAEEERGIILLGLQTKLEALDAENARIDGDFEMDLERLATQKEILAEQEATELQNTDLTEFQKTEIRKKYADERKNITDQEIETEKAAAQAKQEINMAYLGLFEQFGNTLSQLAGKNKALAIAGIVISQAAAIGQIISSTAAANAKAVLASPLSFGQPWVAINTISAGLSIASTIASAAKSIQQINSQPGASSGTSGASGGASAASLPTPPRVAGTTAPQIQTGGGMNPTTQLGQTLTNAQKPLRAYVVSQDIQSQTALDRRTNRAATFSGG